ncbi:MAG: sodium/proton-translocating pyrophosphatase, partial [Eubacteriales bacterium]
MLLTLLAPIGALSALVFAFVMARRVLKLPEGNDQMKKISLAVRRGANAYLRRQ